ncbi:MAG: magnesium chelatase subunit D family protein [Acidiferrobacterales bacterium]
MTNTNFPLAAIVGQEQLITALLLCAIDPTLGGVLIRGDKGTAKSTAARALADILPPIERIAGCAFNCPPGAPCIHCETCAAPEVTAQTAPVPFITLPLGATEDRVLGTLDLERALKGAKRVFQPGLLAAAHRGILYIDEVNLLPDHLVDVLLDAAAMGINSVQREGLSIEHPARFTLIGTMNLEEGDLRPQLLDRFGLMVDVTTPREKHLRSDIVRRRIAFDADAARFIAAWSEKQDALRRQLATARQLLPTVILEDDLLNLISHICCEFDVASLRADIVMHKASRTLAALDGRTRVTSDDVRRAAELALPHRRRRKPFEQPGLDSERLDKAMQQNPPLDTAAGGTQDNESPTDRNDADSEPKMFEAASAGTMRRISVDGAGAHQAAGRRSTVADAPRGRIVRAIPDAKPTSLAIGATLHSAALRNPTEFRVTRTDLHQQVRAGKCANLILFVVDASGSMAAQRRMEAVKGAVLTLLTDAYQQRDDVAVIAFRGESAQLLLAPTHRVELAEQGLHALPTGGRTPLPHALQLALETVDRADPRDMAPLLILLSDGRANVPLEGSGDPWQETLTLAGMVAERSIAALVLDTETGYLRLGRARQIAQAMCAECLTLEELSAEQLALTIRARQGLNR